MAEDLACRDQAGREQVRECSSGIDRQRLLRLLRTAHLLRLREAVQARELSSRFKDSADGLDGVAGSAG